jgi:hypothetical protein
MNLNIGNGLSDTLGDNDGAFSSSFNNNQIRERTESVDQYDATTKIDLPNISQLGVNEYTDKERDLIQRCFRTGNYNAHN